VRWHSSLANLRRSLRLVKHSGGDASTIKKSFCAPWYFHSGAGQGSATRSVGSVFPRRSPESKRFSVTRPLR
jgi:hypothetical protein